MQRVDIDHGIWCVEGFLNADECSTLIARAEAIGFESATINTQAGAKLAPDTRDNDRVIFDDPAYAQLLWNRLSGEVPAFRAGRQARGLNERFRLYRYTPGQKFRWHVDGPFRRGNGEASLFTFMIYLNEGYRGGATVFPSVEVVGRQGMALIFEHGLMHEGAELIEGVKYALRSDIMYGSVGEMAG